MLPERRMHSAFFNLTHQLDDDLQLFTETRYSERDMRMVNRGNPTVFFVPVSNPFYVNPFASAGDVIVAYDLGKDFGILTQQSVTRTATAVVGLEANFSHDWSLELAGSWGREKNDWSFLNDYDFVGASAAIGQADVRLAFNPFGDGSFTNPAVIDSLRMTRRAEGISTIWTGKRIAKRSVLELPTGVAHLAVGLDYRDERLVASTGLLFPATNLFERSTASIGEIGRQVSAAFTEPAIPLNKGEQVTRRVCNFR